MQKLRKFIVLCTLVMFSATDVVADNSNFASVTFVEESGWPPFTPDKIGQVKEGLSYEILSEIFNRLDVKIKLELLPQKRMLHYLKNGQRDGVSLISNNSERSEYLLFSDALLTQTDYFYFNADAIEDFNWKSYRDLKKYILGVVAGHNIGEKFEQAIINEKLPVNRVTTEAQNYRLLEKGRVDLILSDPYTINYYRKRFDSKLNLKRADKAFISKSYHIAISKYSPFVSLLGPINEVIKQMKLDGSLEAILGRYALP